MSKKIDKKIKKDGIKKMEEQLIEICVKLIKTVEASIVPLVIFTCVLIVSKLISKIIITANKTLNDNEIKEKEIELLKEKYKNENNK